MTARELTNQILALPLEDRVTIAEAIWESIEGQHPSPEPDAQAIATARQRDKEMSDGEVSGRSHEDVMQTARQSIQCE